MSNEEMVPYVLCYNKLCKSKESCQHWFKRHGKKEGGFVKFVGSNNENICSKFDPIQGSEEKNEQDKKMPLL